MELKSHFNHNSFLRRAVSLLAVGAATVAFQGVAYAHHIIVAANASCSNGAAFINYTITSYDQSDTAGSNPAVNVTFNGGTVDTEPFLLTQTPPNQFSKTLPWPDPAATPTVDVSANTTSLWGDDFDPANDDPTNVVTLTFPTNCTNPPPPPGIGRFTGGGKQVAAGTDALGNVVTITKGFEVDCDLHTPSNNLEINWGGNHFHMLAFTEAVCTLVGPPNPPKAPVNTIVAMGTGRYDGVDGYTVVFELQDNGEPGHGVDMAGFVVYETANPTNVVLNVPVAFVTDGNIQAHVDQK
jgi:hypothetical protein